MTAAQITKTVLAGGMLLGVPAILSVLAAPRLVGGLGIEPAYRLVGEATLGVPLSASATRAAASAYAGVATDDADNLAQRAEFLKLADGNDPRKLLEVRELLIRSLTHAPVNPRAWTLLCRVEAKQSPARAVACLDTGFFVAPFDWFITGQRMSLVAAEWPYLDERLRDAAANEILPMWNSAGWSNGRTLRYALYDLSRFSNGRQLLRAGFISDRKALFAFNRFVVQERINGR